MKTERAKKESGQTSLERESENLSRSKSFAIYVGPYKVNGFGSG